MKILYSIFNMRSKFGKGFGLLNMKQALKSENLSSTVAFLIARMKSYKTNWKYRKIKQKFLKIRLKLFSKVLFILVS